MIIIFNCERDGVLKGRIWRSLLLLIFVIVLFPKGVMAAEKPDTSEAEKAVKLTMGALDKADFDQAKVAFQDGKLWWTRNKQDVKGKSYDLAQQMDRQVAVVSLGILNGEAKTATDGLQVFQGLLRDYRDGTYTDNDGNTKITLASYIKKLGETRQLVENKDWGAVDQQVQDLQKQWLSVEGDVVSQSQVAYDNMERDLMLLAAYVQDPTKQERTADVLDGMEDTLKPFANVTYTWFDAALIPFREGLEALLIVATLLTFAKRAKTPNARKWIVGGTAAGLLVSLVLGLIVAVWLSTLAFGKNNTLINGWTGVIASLMMLYVSYWLHSNSDMAKWNNYMATKSDQAISNGKMISFAVLAFLAIMREGLETVIFLIGMVGRMSTAELITGILVGLGVLCIIAVVMLKFSVHLPLKPFFMISSAIVFYLCFKFMGSGIHSLQLAGVIPATVQDYLPSIPALSIYPSWYSLLPQLIFVLVAVVILVRSALKKRAMKQLVDKGVNG
ncbi:FTR1 family iron permease [Listeria booriae]|uniref:FTR1 family iron permease n=1 Tax=Listeria booriae TaxID=1552123 RepID=UPI00162AD798|nr:FTR1 family iron permease [Listeria booriae]